jgi:ABC-type glycerol-3-phosphate transport system substrate-binding protein
MGSFTRRSIIRAIFGVAGTGLLAACTAQTPTAPTTAPAAINAPRTAATTTAPTALKGTKIVGVFPSGSTFEAMYQQEAKDFEATTGIKLEYSSIPFENLMDREMTLVGARSSDVDVFGTHYAQIGRFGDAMLPLNDLAARANITADQFIAGSFDAFTIDSKLLAIPLHFDIRALFYRTDVFKSSGVTNPPKSWTSSSRSHRQSTIHRTCMAT